MRTIQTIDGTRVQLSPRECQVIRELCHGETNKGIDCALGISVATVKGHIAHMIAVLHVANRIQLCLWAVAHPECMAGIAVATALVLPFTVA